MKPPYFDALDRQILKADDSLTASRMKLFIAKKRFERSLIRSIPGVWLTRQFDWILSKLS